MPSHLSPEERVLNADQGLPVLWPTLDTLCPSFQLTRKTSSLKCHDQTLPLTILLDTRVCFVDQEMIKLGIETGPLDFPIKAKALKGCISDFFSRNINYYIHLIFPPDQLAARLISRPSKKRISIGSLHSKITQKNQPSLTPYRAHAHKCY